MRKLLIFLGVAAFLAITSAVDARELKLTMSGRLDKIIDDDVQL